MAKLDTNAWDRIRRLYETSDLSVEEIALRSGTTVACIYYRRRLEAWPKRSVMTPTQVAAAAQRYRDEDERAGTIAADAAGDSNSPESPKVLRRYGCGARFGKPAAGAALPDARTSLDRVRRIIEITLEKMETSLENQKVEDSNLTDQERSARTVGALVRTIEKVTEFEAGNDDAFHADIDRNATAELRRELAERIYRMWGGPKR